jgi:hypothetical protein
MAKSPFSDSFLFCLGEKKNLSPNFGVIVFFLDLVDFQSTGSWDFSSLFFDKRPLNVGCRVENVFYLKDFVTWLVCEMLSDILFLRAWSSSFSRSIREEKSPYKVWAPCRDQFKIDSHGFGCDVR